MNEQGCTVETPLFEYVRSMVERIDETIDCIKEDLTAYHAALIGEYQCGDEIKEKSAIPAPVYGGYMGWLQNALMKIESITEEIRSIERSLDRYSK